MPLNEKDKEMESQENTTEKKKKGRNKFKVQVAEVSSSSDAQVVSFTQDFKVRDKLLFKPGGKWFDHKVLVTCEH